MSRRRRVFWIVVFALVLAFVVPWGVCHNPAASEDVCLGVTASFRSFALGLLTPLVLIAAKKIR